MANNIGLSELYERFGEKPFRGTPLREVMIQVIGGPTKPKAGWQASTALGRLTRAGVVKVLSRGPESERAWGNTYQISPEGLALVAGPTESAITEAGVVWSPPPGMDRFLERLNEADGPMAVRGNSWQKWAQLDWAQAHGLISVEYVARVSITSLGSQYAEGMVDEVEEVNGTDGGPRAGARITAKVYHAIKALGRNPHRNGILPDELSQALGMPRHRIERQMAAAIDNGYIRVSAEGYVVIFEQS